MNKGIFIDLDGTLLSDEFEISKLDQEAIKKTQLNGDKIYLITGKSIEHSIKYYNQLHLETPLISSAGQIISYGSNIIEQNIVNVAEMNNLLKDPLLKNIIADFIVQTHDTIYTTDLKSSALKIFFDKKINVKVCELNKIKNPIGLYLNLKLNGQTSPWKIISQISVKWKKWFAFHPWEILTNVFIIHVVPIGINKWTAIQKIVKIDNLNYVVAFGNGRNDIPILKNANLSFAMQNSTDEVKMYSQKVTKFDNNNSGVGHELLELLKKSQN